MLNPPNFPSAKNHLAPKVVTALIAHFGVGIALSAVLMQGLIERASNASQRLKTTHIGLHRKLVKAELDMIYFLVEDMVALFVTSGTGSDFNKVLIKTLK